MPDPIPPLPREPLPGPTGMPGVPATPPMMPPPVPTMEEVPVSHPMDAYGTIDGVPPEQVETIAGEQVRRRRRRRDANGNLVEFMPEQVTVRVPEVEEPELPEDTGSRFEQLRNETVPTRPAPISPSVVDPNAKPKFWVNVGATVNIGNFENMKIDMGVSGIEYDANSEDIERIMESAQVGIHEVVESLMSKVIDRAMEIKIARGIPLGGE